MNELTQTLKTIHRKKDFYSGNVQLDTYLQKQANQDIKRKLSACFVLIHEDTNTIKGFYTLASNSVPQDWIPSKIKQKLPKAYSSIPTILLGRLAVDISFQKQGIGKLLLIDALRRCHQISKSLGSFAVVVDPIDNQADQFYNKYGFIKLPDSGKRFLPMNTINQLFQ
mgnify:CR=1 FL=1